MSNTYKTLNNELKLISGYDLEHTYDDIVQLIKKDDHYLEFKNNPDELITIFNDSIVKNHTSLFDLIIESFPELVNNDKNLFIVSSIKVNNLYMLKKILTVNPNLGSIFNYLPLRTAIELGNLEITSLLLSYDVKGVLSSNCHPIALANKLGYSDIAQLLISNLPPIIENQNLFILSSKDLQSQTTFRSRINEENEKLIVELTNFLEGNSTELDQFQKQCSLDNKSPDPFLKYQGKIYYDTICWERSQIGNNPPVRVMIKVNTDLSANCSNTINCFVALILKNNWLNNFTFTSTGKSSVPQIVITRDTEDFTFQYDRISLKDFNEYMDFLNEIRNKVLDRSLFLIETETNNEYLKN